MSAVISATGRASIGQVTPLFLVSLAAVGFEIALIRYFAIASWSEYGYWVISITMVGFAASGVVLSLTKDWMVRRGVFLVQAIPVALIPAAAIGYCAITVNPFNPLELQNRFLWAVQLWNIGGYYLALFPFFFLAGLYIGLNFLMYERDLGRVYGFDLAGAGIGAALVLVLMFVVHPFDLPGALLPFLAVAAVLAGRGRARWISAAVAVWALAGSAWLLHTRNEARFNEYKAIYAPLNVPGGGVVAEVRSPKGLYLLLDNFTERLDTDFSNNPDLVQAAAPPQTYGLYADGNRLTSLAKPGAVDFSYVRGTLDSLPYLLRPGAPVLQIGTSGGFRVREALALGATQVVALEPDAVVRRAVRDGLGPAAALHLGQSARLLAASPAAAAAATDRRFGIVDVAGDFLGQADANKYAFTVEALRDYVRLLDPDGIVSVQVSMREFTVYAVKLIGTARQALLAAGIADPSRHMVVYRSAWNARILLSAAPWTGERIAAIRAFCDERSFDVSYFPGIDPAAARIYNDLPAVSFADASVARADRATDAIMDEAVAILAGRPSPQHGLFDIAPATHDRPSFHSALKLAELDRVLRRIDMVPREEIGFLVNLAVIVQSVLLAALVLLLPLAQPAAARPPARGLLQVVLYFAGLGLGFLLIEIYLIEKTAFYLHDRTYAFAIVLAGMLIFSGLGSMLAGRFNEAPKRGLRMAVAAIVVWCALAWLALDPLLLATVTWPWPLRAAIVLALAAPVSVALGLPMPLGLSQLTGPNGAFLPWAWALNGAFSVIATPLANLIGLSIGLSVLAILGLLSYLVVAVTLPRLSPRGAS